MTPISPAREAEGRGRNPRKPRRGIDLDAAVDGPNLVERSRVAAYLRQARVAALLGRDAPSLDDLDPSVSALVLKTADTFANSIAASTRAAYSRRWVLFEQWCAQRQLQVLPASPDTVMLYLADTAGEGVALSTLRGWMAAINRVHIEAGHPGPGADPGMSMFLRGLSRTAVRRRRKNVRALRVAQLRQVCAVLDDGADPAPQVRDRAILCLHRAGLSDGAISRLRWDDLRVSSNRVVVTLRSPRPAAQVRSVSMRRRKDAADCPVDALTRWQRVALGQHDHVFARVDVHGRCADHPLSPKSVYAVRKSRRSGYGNEVDAVIAALGRPTPEATRDKAMILVGFSGAFRRVDLTRLTWGNVQFREQGAIVHLDRSKTDKEGRGTDVGIPQGKSTLTCPVTALALWQSTCKAAGVARPEDPVFVRVGRSGRLGKAALTPEALTYIVKRRAQEAGLGGTWGGRSLRAGFISSAADLDIPLELIARQSRHATLDTLMLYIRSEDPFRRNASTDIGL